MKRILALGIAFAALALAQWKDEPLVGRWQMISQTIGTAKSAPLPEGIRITQKGGDLVFAYVSGKEDKLNMTFTVRVDGPEADVKNAAGARIGTAKLTKIGSKYELSLARNNRPAEPGTLTLSDGNYVLTVETFARVPEVGTTRVVRVFAKE